MVGDIDISNRDNEKTDDLCVNHIDDSSNMMKDAISPATVESVDTTFFVQQYTCESGKIAKFIIPEDATEDDLLGFRDILNIALKRKFKLKKEN